ncbi:unnamed protein product [Nezara viridula]|uniref:Uncharacterized protein n=1 Tax=Nezara viridula TaxID=85310 RepID=A0A9P0E3P8_NEZVI|nr:unnamed protein product [Nezara viridula]
MATRLLYPRLTASGDNTKIRTNERAQTERSSPEAGAERTERTRQAPVLASDISDLAPSTSSVCLLARRHPSRPEGVIRCVRLPSVRLKMRGRLD